MATQKEILDFWFEGVDSTGLEGPPSCLARWFGADPKLDALIRDRFGGAVESALAGDTAIALVDGVDSPQSQLALVILLDQFTRSIYRGDARAFVGDGAARRIATNLVEKGADKELRPAERYFLYLPFEHAEDSFGQARAVRLYQELAGAIPKRENGLFTEAAEWALRHQVVIDRFGRFPSRNAAIGRRSTPAELAYLEENPTGF